MIYNNYKYTMYAFVLALLPATTSFAAVHETVHAGLAALRAGHLEEAESSLRRAQFDVPGDPRIAYDLGIVAYHERRFAEAAQEFESVASNTATNPGLAADALHNLGNARFQSGEYGRAVEAYQAALARREDPETQYNLEQAQKRLAEQQQNAGKEGQQNQQAGQKEKSGGNEQQNAGKEGQQNQQAGKEPEKASDAQKLPSEPSQGKTASGTGNPDDRQSQSQQQQANASDSAKPDDSVASESTSWNEQDAKLRDVKLDPESQSKKDIPDASQRARAMKNRKINPYMIEKLLRQMEEREKEIQRRYRRDPSDRDIDDPFADPFFMDPDRMRDFMEGRRGGRPKPEGDTPDW